MKKILIAIGALALIIDIVYVATPKQTRLGDSYRLKYQQTTDAEVPAISDKKLEKPIDLFYFKNEDQKCTEAVAVSAPELDRRVAFQEITALNALLTRPVPDGYKSAVIPGTGALDFRIVDGVATLDLGSFLIIGNGACTYEARKDQVTKTLIQFGSLKQIRLLSEGKEVGIFP